GGVARLRGEEAQGVVPPVVRQPLVDEEGLVVGGVDGQQLHRGDAQGAQVGDGRRVGQPRVGAAQVLGDARQLLGQATHVGLVDHRPLPRRVRTGAVRHRQDLVEDDAVGYVSGGVQVAAVPAGDGREVLVDDVPVDLRGVAERSGDAPGVGVEEELGGVVPQAGGRVPAAVHAQPVALPGRHVRHVALPHAVAPAVQRVAPLGEAGGGGGVLVVQAQVDRGGVGGDHGDV